jgi:hypothetical protein
LVSSQPFVGHIFATVDSGKKIGLKMNNLQPASQNECQRQAPAFSARIISQAGVPRTTLTGHARAPAVARLQAIIRHTRKRYAC